MAFSSGFFVFHYFSTLGAGRWTDSILLVTHYGRQERKLSAVSFQLTQFSH